MKVVPVGGSPPPAGYGDVVLACGTPAVKFLQDMGLVHKNRTVTSLRENPIPYKLAHILVSYDPRITEKEYKYLPDIQWDLQLAARLHTTGSTQAPIGHYKLVESLHEIIQQIEEKYEQTQKPVEVSCDLETKGLDPYAPHVWIIACSFTVKPGESHVLYFDRDEKPLPFGLYSPSSYWVQLWEQINWILTSPKVSIRGANFKYDSTWLRRHWSIECINFKFDTVLVGSLLEENRCVDAGTRLLTADLQWVRAGEVHLGMELMGFDEHLPPGMGLNRKLRVAKVLDVGKVIKLRVRITMKSGRVLIVNGRHLLLRLKYTNNRYKWIPAIRLKPGDKLKTVCLPPTDTSAINEFERGRLSGFLDGEGCCYKLSPKYGAWNVSWFQKEGAVHEEMKLLMEKLGIEYHEYNAAKNLGKQVICKGSWYALALLIATRPIRLIAKRKWIGGSLPSEPEFDVIESVEKISEGELISITTSTHTFVAEGIASHNSNSLKLHAKIFTTMGSYEDDLRNYDMGALEKVPIPDLVRYVGVDSDATYRVAAKMKRLQKN